MGELFVNYGRANPKIQDPVILKLAAVDIRQAQHFKHMAAQLQTYSRNSHCIKQLMLWKVKCTEKLCRLLLSFKK